jgi:hypothetical protein
MEQDEKGRWKNIEFPPDSFRKYPHKTGYRTANREYLYYQFAVQYYDVCVTYRERTFNLIADSGGCSVEAKSGERISDLYPTANDLIKEFRFDDGKSLSDVVDDKNFIIDIL